MRRRGERESGKDYDGVRARSCVIRSRHEMSDLADSPNRDGDESIVRTYLTGRWAFLVVDLIVLVLVAVGWLVYDLVKH